MAPLTPGSAAWLALSTQIAPLAAQIAAKNAAPTGPVATLRVPAPAPLAAVHVPLAPPAPVAAVRVLPPPPMAAVAPLPLPPPPPPVAAIRVPLPPPPMMAIPLPPPVPFAPSFGTVVPVTPTPLSPVATRRVPPPATTPVGPVSGPPLAHDDTHPTADGFPVLATPSAPPAPPAPLPLPVPDAPHDVFFDSGNPPPPPITYGDEGGRVCTPADQWGSSQDPFQPLGWGDVTWGQPSGDNQAYTDPTAVDGSAFVTPNNPVQVPDWGNDTWGTPSANFQWQNPAYTNPVAVDPSAWAPPAPPDPWAGQTFGTPSSANQPYLDPTAIDPSAWVTVAHMLANLAWADPYLHSGETPMQHAAGRIVREYANPLPTPLHAARAVVHGARRGDPRALAFVSRAVAGACTGCHKSRVTAGLLSRAAQLADLDAHTAHYCRRAHAMRSAHAAAYAAGLQARTYGVGPRGTVPVQHLGHPYGNPNPLAQAARQAGPRTYISPTGYSPEGSPLYGLTDTYGSVLYGLGDLT